MAGLVIFYLAFIAYNSQNPLILYLLTTFLVILGGYVLIASLIPYKNTTKGVAEIVLELLFQIIIEFIPRLIAVLFRTIANLFSH